MRCCTGAARDDEVDLVGVREGGGGSCTDELLDEVSEATTGGGPGCGSVCDAVTESATVVSTKKQRNNALASRRTETKSTRRTPVETFMFSNLVCFQCLVDESEKKPP